MVSTEDAMSSHHRERLQAFALPLSPDHVGAPDRLRVDLGSLQGRGRSDGRAGDARRVARDMEK